MTHWFHERSEREGLGFSLAYSKQVHSEQTPYQQLDIYQTEQFGYLMVLDGYIMLTTRDNFIYHEMLVHPALCSHANPENVVIIGGGDCGTLQQVLQHAVKQVVQIEIDEAVTQAAQRYFPELCTDNNDPRAQLQFDDGIAWIKQAAPHSIDIIIVDSTDPVGPAEGLFQQPFYEACWRALKPDGVFVQQSESPLLHFDSIIQPMQNTLQAVGFIQTQTCHFPQPVYPSGWWSATIASKQPVQQQMRHLNTRYYNHDIHQAAFVLPQFMR